MRVLARPQSVSEQGFLLGERKLRRYFGPNDRTTSFPDSRDMSLENFGTNAPFSRRKKIATIKEQAEQPDWI
jgi:hypothetical protein